MLGYWKLWSVKETAYKAWQRQANASPIFNPTTFECKMITESRCLVAKGVLNFNISIITTSEFIYSRIISKKGLVSKVFNSESSFQIFINQLNQKGWDLKKDNNGIPCLYSRQKSKILPISISHDQHRTAVQVTKHIADFIFEKA